MIQVGREEFMLFLQGKGLDGKPAVGFNNATMQFVDKDGKVHAQSTYTSNGGFVSVRYEIRAK